MSTARGVDRERWCTRADILRSTSLMLFSGEPLEPPDPKSLPYTGLFNLVRGVARHLSRPCTHKSRLVSSGRSMSALPPKADIRQRIEHVCFVPTTDIGR